MNIMNQFIQWIIHLYRPSKIKPIITKSSITSLLYNRPSLTHSLTHSLTDNKFYILTQHIRNLQELIQEELEYIKHLSKENLLQLIEIYNKDIMMIQQLISSMNSGNDN